MCFFFFVCGSVCAHVGVEDRNIIPDAKMMASTMSGGFPPYYGRLNENRGNKAWSPKTKNDRTDYLQVDMGAVHFVCAVATQGSGSSSEWTTSFKLHLSTDQVTWQPYKENNVEKVKAKKMIDSIFIKIIYFVTSKSKILCL